MRLTPTHNLIFYDIEPSQQSSINAILEAHGVKINPHQLNELTRYGMACPSYPTCGLAITESERVFPTVLARINQLLKQLDMENESIRIRMTGCPNGCVRPYLAELGFVGSGPEMYQVWLGGNPEGTQLAKPYIQRLHIKDLETFLEPILLYFKTHREPKERLGTFCNRIGFGQLRAAVGT